MPRTKRRERHKLNKTKKIYYGGWGPEETESKNIIKESHNKTIEKNENIIDEIKINEINKIINVIRTRNLTEFWLTGIILGGYFIDNYDYRTNPNRVKKHLLNEGEKDISYENINRILEKKVIGLPMLFHQVGRDLKGQYGNYIKVNNSAIIEVIKNLSNEEDVEKKYKDYINNYYDNDIIPALGDDNLRGFKLMLYYKNLINEHKALVTKILNKKLSMDNILLQIIFFTSNQSEGSHRIEFLNDILSKNTSVMNVFSQLNSHNYTTSAESSFNIINFTINNDYLKETLPLNDIIQLVTENNKFYIGYVTGTIEIDYLNQTYTENISIHIDPRVTYANKLLPASAPVDPVAPEPEPEEEPIDNEDIIDIFYSTNLNKNQNYYIFNMLETMS